LSGNRTAGAAADAKKTVSDVSDLSKSPSAPTVEVVSAHASVKAIAGRTDTPEELGAS